MLTINLLPNHDHKLSVNSIALGTIEILLMTATVGLILASIWLQTAVSGVSTQVATKKAEQDSFKSSLEKAAELQQKLQNVIDRKSAWESSEKENSHYGELLSEIALATPPKFRLDSIESEKDSGLTINGTASSRADIATFIENLNQVKGLSEVTLGQANTLPTGVSFGITAKLGAAAASPSPVSTP